MAILGIYDGHNAGAAIISEQSGEVLAAVEEERFSRIKNHDARGDLPGPLHSVMFCVSKTDEPVTTLAIGLEEPQDLQRRAINNFLHDVQAGQHQRLNRARERGTDFHEMMRMPLVTQKARVAKCLATVHSAGVSTGDMDVHYVAHHQSHAAGAFLLSPIDSDVLLLTLDGKGDDVSGSVSVGSGHQIRPIDELSTLQSLGHLYSAFTVATGFRPQRDEGKLMALAASGSVDDRLLCWLNSMFRHDRESGALLSHFSSGLVVGPYPDRVPSGHNDRVREQLMGLEAADAAATIQYFLEDIVSRWASHHLLTTGLTKLAVSGGVFANVSVNLKLAELPFLQELHVHPAMTDAGIAAGAAASVFARLTGRRPRPLVKVDLGPSFGDDMLAAAFKKEGYRIEERGRPENHLAHALAQGAIVARIVGGSEYGPRALGQRSILAPAHDPDLTVDLNRRLGRSQVMPFAPVSRAVDAKGLYRGLEKVRWPTQFMTTAVRCRKEMLDTFPAAVHRDGTARPQIVNDDSSLYSLLSEYRRLSNHKVLINTSFNLHDEPMVCTPKDAAYSARVAGIQMVQAGNLVAYCQTDAENLISQ